MKVILIVFGTIFDIATKPLFTSNKLITHTKKNALLHQKKLLSTKKTALFTFFSFTLKVWHGICIILDRKWAVKLVQFIYDL